jgi:hypothetical protein
MDEDGVIQADDDVPLGQIYSHLATTSYSPPLQRSVRVRRGSEGYEVRSLSVFEKDEIARRYEPDELEGEWSEGSMDVESVDSLEGL